MSPTCTVLLIVGALGACAAGSTGSSPATSAITPETLPIEATTTTATPSTSAVATLTTPASPGAPRDTAQQRWTEDMQALAAGIRRIHPDPFWRQNEAAFDASLAGAPGRLATLSDSDARAEVMRLTAGIDGHTGVYLHEAGFQLYAIHLYSFGDHVVIIAAPDPVLFGAEVLAINGTPTATVIAAVTPYSPFDNAATVKLVVPTLLATPQVLHAAGVVDDVATPRYTVRLTDGSERTVDPVRLSWDDYTKVDPRPIGMTKLASIPSLARVDEPFWMTMLDRAGPDERATLYVQYNEVVGRSGGKPIEQLAADVGAALDSGAASRLVIDLRYNPGGNDLTYPPLLRVLSTHPVLAPRGSLVVLIGRQTFSAAALFAAELDNLTTAVFVGEPTGGRPNLYANPRPLKLPNSGLVVQVSSKYFRAGGVDDRRDAIPPDIPASTGVEDLLAGRDPVLSAALAVG